VKVLHLGFKWLLLPLALVVLLLLFLFFTTAGARVVATVAEQALPPLKIQGLDGSIAYGLIAHQVVWSQPEVTVTLDGLASLWNPRCLLRARICVYSLVAGRLHIDVPDSAENKDDDDGEVTPIDLPLLVLPWRLRVEQFHLAELLIQAGGRLTRVSPVAFRAEWLGSRVAIERFQAATEDGDIGIIDATLTGAIDMKSEWPFNAVVKADYIPPLEGWKSQHVTLAGEGNIRNLLLRGSVNAAVAVPDLEPLRFNADITTQSLNSEIHLQELHGQWNGAPLFAKGDAHFSRTGELQFKDMQILWGKNKATLNGRLQQQWDVQAALALVEPQLLAADASGELHGSARISGARSDPLIDVQLISEELNLPQLRLQQFSLRASVAPVSLSSLDAAAAAASLQFGDEQLQAVDVALQGDAGAHRVTLQATRGQQHLQASAEGALNVDTFDWRGSVMQLQLQLEKDWRVRLQDPVALQWQQQAQTVRWDHHCLQDESSSICSQGLVNVPGQRGDIRIDVSQFDLRKLQLFLDDNVRLQGVLTAQLQLKERFLRPDLQGRATITGLAWRDVDAKVALLEQGDVAVEFAGKRAEVKTTLDAPPGVRWQSEEPALIEWSTRALQMQRTCWQALRVATAVDAAASLGELCLQGKASEQAGLFARADLALEVDAATRPFLPPELQLHGRLQGHAEGRLKGRSLLATLQLAMAQGEVVWQRDEQQEPVRAPVESFRIDARIQDEVLQTSVALQSSRLGDASATASLQIRSPDPQLDLQAHLQGLNLELAQPLLPQLSELQGMIDMALQMRGSVQAPAVNGQVDVRGVKLQSAGIPAGIDDLNARLVFTGHQGELTGELKSGKGRAQLSGDFSLEQSGWQARVNLRGRNIPVAQPPDIRFMMHPDLTLQADASGISLQGTLLVNSGFLVLKPLPPDAIGVSSDVEFVDARGSRLETATAMTIEMDVVASVEPSLRIRGFGGEIRPKGSVRVLLDRTGVLIGRGTIDIEEGRYTGYGQQLTIRKGQAIFNGPLNQPFINLEAVRQVDTVVAGIRVTGPASEPVATLFSEPTMSDSQILYYIIAGKAPGTGTEDDNTAVRNALLSMGLMGGQPLARDIASKVGIDDLQMGTAGSGQETAVTLSGYLNSRTFLQYGISVFEPVNTLTVRYRLTDKLFLEAVSGMASALDLLYSFEF
jgi:autotransporter translocation and assembly factor TamB